MWLTRALFVVVIGWSVAGPARAESTATLCPSYGGLMLQARDALQRGDRPSALAALHEAQAALAECMRHEAENAEQPVFLVSSAERPLG